MIIVLNKQIEPGDKERIVGYLKEKGFRIREIQGESDTVLGAVGSAAVDHNEIRVLPGVAEVIPISKPYKLASREFKKTDTVINIGGVKDPARWKMPSKSTPRQELFPKAAE